MSPRPEFEIELDAGAREWLASHPVSGARVIEYEVHRCCGGGKICQVKVRTRRDSRDRREFAIGATEDATRFEIDPRAAARLPRRFGVTVRGMGPMKRLDLDLAPEQWGALLYD